ncbi:hypothetical protein GCM10010472_21080 [Pseudonocardia halophobica]|uniref:EamA domain-containing protein n=1 Tax=Pseudonocardia halophobica TaxID=29401 RepID=A0A9W6NTI9_9PSEU|nr:DMT family transporter [Pseudonocardia halophobica]GLL09340.1 hypothetical protein GCM10017577_04800 [Pseudonocardia halophobica]
MTFQAHALGLSVRQFRAFDRVGVEAEFAVPAHWQVTTMAAFGVSPVGAASGSGASASVPQRQRRAAERDQLAVPPAAVAVAPGRAAMNPGALARSPIPLGGEVAVLASAIGFGVGTSVSVLALRGLRPADLLAVELGGSAIVLLTVAATTGRLRRAGAGRGLVQGALTPGLSFLLGDLGLARTSATSGSLLLGTEMLLTVLLAAVVLRERVDPRSAGALVLGLAGTAVVSFGTAPSDLMGGSVVGNLLVLASVACGATFTVWSRRAKDEKGEGLSLTTWQFLGAALAVSPLVLGTWATGGTRLATADPRIIGAAVVVLCCGVGALLAFNTGIRTVTATRAALLENLQPVAGTVTAVALLGESLGAGQALGGGLVVAGLTLLLQRRTLPPTTADEAQTRPTGSATPPSTTESCGCDDQAA